MKKIISILLVSILLLSGCTFIKKVIGIEEEKQDSSAINENTFFEGQEEVENDTELISEGGIIAASYDFRIFFEGKLGYDLSEIGSENLRKIIKNYEKANEIYSEQDYVSIEILKLKSEVNQFLRASGYEIPLQSLVDAANYLKKDITYLEYKELIRLAKATSEYSDENTFIENSALADKIISKFGLSAEELLNQGVSDSIQLALYKVENGKITRDNLDIQIDDNEDLSILNEHQKVWDKIEMIVPDEYMNMIDTYEISTDGFDEVIAYVDEEYNKKWRISVDLKDILSEDGSFYGDAMNTLVHELAHIISLNKEQMTDDESDDSLYVVEEGTLKADAYLNQYYHRFWKDIIVEHSLVDGDEGLTEFFESRETEFVTEYAATNPEEDFAESFAYFVNGDKPTDNSVKSQKILFFYEYPEFVSMRDDIRDAIGK
ncbi:MAG: hypothetical protein CSB16_01760 [Clostridiales bacterium]|nr:MAG: hypothetical protein CSB16_01760 [Clostridiales bacterium]